jgi:glycosyltransferase involved in cell wall biosynthesis
MSSGSHNAYRNMVANAPDGFQFSESDFMAHGIVQASRGLHAGLSAKALGVVRSIQPVLSPYYNHARIVADAPKLRKFHASGYDLVHSGQSLLETNMPYVVDFEHAAAFCGYNQYALRRPSFVRALERILLNGSLKTLLAWSDAARNSLVNVLQNDEIAQKVETFYPVMAPARPVPRTRNSFNFLFIGNSFYAKGGYESLLAFETLAHKYDCHFTAIGNIPAEVYARFAGNDKITLSQRVPYERVVEFYSNSDVFVFPTHYDTYGFVIPEALSFGLPVISVDSFSTPELVQHGKTGILLKTYFSSFADDYGYAAHTMQKLERMRFEFCRNPPEWYVESLAESMAKFMDDSRFKDECSRNAIQVATEGKFSPKKSREQLRRIYEDAINV